MTASRVWLPSRRQVAGLRPYLVAAALYVVLGLWDPRWLLSWLEGLAFALLVVWAVPALHRRWWRR